MPWRLISVTALFLLMVAAGSISLADAARRVPWDCANWTAFVHDDRTTAILETLAENRGQTLYCGIDQSDTFTKAETWAAGRDRNERDDTVYFGENGNFRGFIAAQEGWLTEGESGITGQSTATIFEFPRSGRRVIRVKRRDILPESPLPTYASNASCQNASPPGDQLCSEWSNVGTGGTFNDAQSGSDGFPTDNRHAAFRSARQNYNRDSRWIPTGSLPQRWDQSRPDYWQALANQVAGRKCRALGSGWRLVRATVGPSHNNSRGKANDDVGLGWIWLKYDRGTTPSTYHLQAAQSRTWAASCIKKTRRTR